MKLRLYWPFCSSELDEDEDDEDSLLEGLSEVVWELCDDELLEEGCELELDELELDELELDELELDELELDELELDELELDELELDELELDELVESDDEVVVSGEPAR